MPSSTPKPPNFLPSPLAALALLLFVASLALGVARALSTPPGYNVDEWARMPYILRTAACWRQSAEWLSSAFHSSSPAACWEAKHFAGNPLYYLLLSIPEAFALDQPEATQYLIARLTTVGLGLATVCLAWLTCRELLGDHEGRPYIALGIAAAVALNQGFGDIMSGVNSDASTTAALAVLIYAMARLENSTSAAKGLSSPRRREEREDSFVSTSRLRGSIPVAFDTAFREIRGIRGKTGDAALLAAALFICANSSKSALWLSLPLAAWWGVSQLGGRARLAIIAVILLGGIAALIVPGGPSEWTTPQYWFDTGPAEIVGAAQRVEADGPMGPHALAVPRSDHSRLGAVQFLPDATAQRLAGKSITFGAWLLAPAGEIVPGPIWDDGGQRVHAWMVGTGRWQFVASAAQVSRGARTGAIVLSHPATGARVLFDGLVVAEGVFSPDTPPQFADIRGQSGTWGGRPFDNLLSNPSVEATWPTLREEIGPRDLKVYNGRLRSLLAWRRTAPAYPAVLKWLFVGFWSEFSGIYPGLTASALIPFTLLTAAGVTGAVIVGFSRGDGARRAVRFFAPPAIIIWLAVILRADLWPNLPEVFSFAGARYALTGIMPTMALIVVGSLHWVPHRARRAALAALVLGLWFASVHILTRVQIPFYHCLLQTPAVADCLTTLR
ncbi:MAG: hypothetical protein HY260_01525 [Chloroflexi bacterium]|nr:hypothetical protein [Chloroflexota bacterium]